MLNNQLWNTTNGMIFQRAILHWDYQASLLTLRKTRPDRLKVRIITAAMTCNKRKGVDEKPGVDEMGKKLKMEDDDSELPTLKSQADKFQGADDTAMELLFRDLCRSIQKFAATYFLGKPFIDPRKKEDKAFFESLTSNYSTYLKSQIPDAKETIIQAAIWNKLINVLLKEPIKAFLQVPEALILNHMSGKWPAFTRKEYTG